MAKTLDVTEALLGIIEAGRINSAQEALIFELRENLAGRTIVCKHDAGSYCDASGNIFHCQTCDEVVPNP